MFAATPCVGSVELPHSTGGCGSRSGGAWALRLVSRSLVGLAASCPATERGVLEEESVAQSGRRQLDVGHAASPQQRRVRSGSPQQRRRRAPEDLVSVLARAVSELEEAVKRRRVTPAVRTKFQVVALVLREEHARVQGEQTIGETRRAAQLKRLDSIATTLAKTAVRDPALLALLAEDAVVSDAARSLKRSMFMAAGIEPAPEVAAPTTTVTASASTERRPVPQSVISRQLANPFLAPDFSSARPSAARPRRLAGWELLKPLLSSFERAGAGAPASMALPALLRPSVDDKASFRIRSRMGSGRRCSVPVRSGPGTTAAWPSRPRSRRGDR